jgi:formylglycine-generating enzyme required for sulfatase activity
MVVVPGGTFVMGTARQEAHRLAVGGGYHPSWLSGEVPEREIQVASFAIDIYPVTNGQFAEFCKDTGYAPRMHWNGEEPPADIADHPVVFVDLADCGAYAEWAGKRIPTEAEWEKAARGTDGRRYPWGEEWDPGACHWRRDPYQVTTTAPVTAYPEGVSPCGCHQMTGNVAEYCADGPGPGAAFIKGGAWINEDPINLRPAARNMSGFANNQTAFYGFRCVAGVI